MSESRKMMAVVKTRKERGADYMEVPVPEVGPEEILVKVHAAAICGTDIHIYQWNAWADANVEKAYSKLPRILGHEFSGVVEQVGSQVTQVKVGDRVACETHLPCGECYQCKTGDSYNCQHVKRFKTGVYADYALVPGSCAVKLPETMTFDQGAVMEPFSVAVHAASMVRMVGDTVAVVGCGPIGLFCIKIARAMGASIIFASDVSDYRLQLARKSGADFVFNTLQCNVVQEVKNRTEELGAGTVFDFSGNVEAIAQGFKMLRKCGNMVMTGLPSKPLVLDASDDIVWKAAKIYGVHGREIFTSWEIAKGLIGSGIVSVDDLLTHRFPFSEYEKAFELAEKGLAGKILLYPDSMFPG
ncbi:MAG: alcohol dehydrogenase catalytic domain-containing protein [Eubacteriales bacterium]